MTGKISKIETMGLVDGPGIRTVVFLQGCPLRCLFCHNPEMWKIDGGTECSVEDLVNTIRRYKNYYGENGGVTFSGGEPLTQIDFLLEICDLLKKWGINICLDTSGVGNNYEKLLDYVDLIILDIKHIDSEEYTKLTGYPIEKSLEFIDICNKKNKKIWIRQVIVPGINDNIEYILKLKEFIKKIKNVEKIELLPYHTMAINKYGELNIEYPLRGIKAMDRAKCEELEKILIKND